jgi:hypothetical protein
MFVLYLLAIILTVPTASFLSRFIAPETYGSRGPAQSTRKASITYPTAALKWNWIRPYSAGASITVENGTPKIAAISRQLLPSE